MKKRNFAIYIVMCMLVGSVLGVSAASGSGRYGGKDGKSINKQWHTGWNIQGDYTQATSSNRSDSAAYMKRVYARSGVEGCYSEWVPSGRSSITLKDFGPYKTDKYEAKFYWDYD